MDYSAAGFTLGGNFPKQKNQMKITFIKSPTGAFKLAYSAGDTVEMDDAKAQELMEANFAIPTKTTAKAVDRKETATAKPKKKETRSK